MEQPINTFEDCKPAFRVIIAGGRDFNNYTCLEEFCDKMLADKQRTHRIVIISGCARGADSLGAHYAKRRGYEVREFPADWCKYGKSAGYRRNVEMAENADALIAFWDGASKGTHHMIDIATAKGLSVRVCKYYASIVN